MHYLLLYVYIYAIMDGKITCDGICLFSFGVILYYGQLFISLAAELINLILLIY